jgi:hypothetical protein
MAIDAFAIMDIADGCDIDLVVGGVRETSALLAAEDLIILPRIVHLDHTAPLD